MAANKELVRALSLAMLGRITRDAPTLSSLTKQMGRRRMRPAQPRVAQPQQMRARIDLFNAAARRARGV